MTKEQGEIEAESQMEDFVSHCEVLLGAGKGHLGVINFLRKSGVSGEKINALSIEVFEEANRRLYRSQLPLRIIAGSVIAIGIFVPLAFYFTGDGVPVVTVVPVFIGLVLRTKILRPTLLPSLPK